MNRTTVLAVSAVCASAMLLSCSENLKTRTFEERGMFELSEGASDSLEVEIRAEYPESGMEESALRLMSEAITGSLFGEEYSALPPAEAIENYRNSLIKEYRETNLPLLEIAQQDSLSTAALSWSDYSYGNFSGTCGNTISYLVTKYSFTGGAHGMSAEISLNFNRKTGEPVEETDIFAEDYWEKLAELLNSHLPESLDSPQDTAMLFLKDIEPNGNFSVSEKGVTYIFNQYEIAPYAMGIIRVSIPWEELDGILNEDSPELLK